MDGAFQLPKAHAGNTGQKTKDNENNTVLEAPEGKMAIPARSGMILSQSCVLVLRHYLVWFAGSAPSLGDDVLRTVKNIPRIIHVPANQQ